MAESRRKTTIDEHTYNLALVANPEAASYFIVTWGINIQAVYFGKS